MAKKCMIISGGAYTPIPAAVEDVYVIACDRGYQYALQAEVEPDLVVGDFDSYDGDLNPLIQTQRYKKEKDDTDTMIAVKEALAAGCSEIEIFCALGGRLDHTFANIQSAAYAVERGAFVTIQDNDSVLYFFSAGSMRLPRQEGFSLSVFSITDRCSDVSIRGTKYLLEHVELTNAFPLGVSNEWVEDTAEVCVGSGILMIMLSKLRQDNGLC